MPTAQGVGIYSSCTTEDDCSGFCFANEAEAEGLDLLCNGCQIFSLKISQSLSGVSGVEQSYILQEEEDVI